MSNPDRIVCLGKVIWCSHTNGNHTKGQDEGAFGGEAGAERRRDRPPACASPHDIARRTGLPRMETSSSGDEQVAWLRLTSIGCTSTGSLLFAFPCLLVSRWLCRLMMPRPRGTCRIRTLASLRSQPPRVVATNTIGRRDTSFPIIARRTFWLGFDTTTDLLSSRRLDVAGPKLLRFPLEAAKS